VTNKIQTKTPPGQRKNTSMYSLNKVKTLVSCGRDPARLLPLWRGFLLIPLILGCFAFLPRAQAVCNDACLGNFGTVQGEDALGFAAGAGNSAFGWRSLFFTSTGNFNTAMGPSLILNNADSNTAVGAAALLTNGDGTRNTAVGTDALVFNGFGVSGADFNGAFGAFALFSNSSGFSNNAVGDSALFANLNGTNNTAVGDLALQNNDSSGLGLANFNSAVGALALFGADGGMDGDSNNAFGSAALMVNGGGSFNQAFGAFALSGNVDGASNIAIGDSALVSNGSGSFNTVIGDEAGQDITDGSDNIYIGATAGNGAGNESSTIRIGDPLHVDQCYIAGITGVAVTGDAVFVDADGQLGVAPAGHPLSTTELLKERQIVQQLKATAESQAATIALLTAALKQQAEQIQKVSAQLEMLRPAPRVVNNQ
jgi:hypothetical protein